MCGRVNDFGTYRAEKELDICDWDIVGSELCRATTQSLEGGATAWSQKLRPGTQLEYHMVEAKGCGDCHCRIVAESREKYPMPPHEQWECFGPVATADQIKYTTEEDMVKESMVFREECNYTFANGTNMEQDSTSVANAHVAYWYGMTKTLVNAQWSLWEEPDNTPDDKLRIKIAKKIDKFC